MKFPAFCGVTRQIQKGRGRGASPLFGGLVMEAGDEAVPAVIAPFLNRPCVAWSQRQCPCPTSVKNVLVKVGLLVESSLTMKRIYTLIVLLGIVMGAVLTGCNQGSENPAPA